VKPTAPGARACTPTSDRRQMIPLQPCRGRQAQAPPRPGAADEAMPAGQQRRRSRTPALGLQRKASAPAGRARVATAGRLGGRRARRCEGLGWVGASAGKTKRRRVRSVGAMREYAGVRGVRADRLQIAELAFAFRFGRGSASKQNLRAYAGAAAARVVRDGAHIHAGRHSACFPGAGRAWISIQQASECGVEGSRAAGLSPQKRAARQGVRRLLGVLRGAAAAFIWDAGSSN
jgi:hypothetical protein